MNQADYDVIELVERLVYVESQVLYPYYNSTRTAQKHLKALVDKKILKRQMIRRKGIEVGYLYCLYHTKLNKQVEHTSYTALLIAIAESNQAGAVRDVFYEKVLYKGDTLHKGIRCDAIIYYKSNGRYYIFETQLCNVDVSEKLYNYSRFVKTKEFREMFPERNAELCIITDQRVPDLNIGIPYAVFTLNDVLEGWECH